MANLPATLESLPENTANLPTTTESAPENTANLPTITTDLSTCKSKLPKRLQSKTLQRFLFVGPTGAGECFSRAFQ
jgi:hypothetical protein